MLAVRPTVSRSGLVRKAASRLCAGSYLFEVPFDTDLEQWQAGERRLDEAPPEERAVLEAVTRSVYDELRRRLGGPFTTEELVALYDEGTGWISDLAVATAPDAPFAWDVRIVGDAAFGRYVRRATDWAGGRRN